MKLIDKDEAITEIEKFSAHLDSLHEQRLIEKILSIINTLEVKEVNLEKEYEEFVVDDPIFGNFITNDTMGMKLAKHFFELGLKVQKGE